MLAWSDLLFFGCLPAIHLRFLCKRREAQLAKGQSRESTPLMTTLDACIRSLLTIIVAPWSVQCAIRHRPAQLLLLGMVQRRSREHSCCATLTSGEGLNTSHSLRSKDATGQRRRTAVFLASTRLASPSCMRSRLSLVSRGDYAPLAEFDGPGLRLVERHGSYPCHDAFIYSPFFSSRFARLTFTTGLAVCQFSCL